MIIFNIRKNITDIANNKAGNFGMMSALLLSVLIPIAGIVVDLTGLMNTRAKMRDVSDAGALAAASALVQQDVSFEDARTIAMNYLKAGSSVDIDISSGAKISLSSSKVGINKVYQVKVDTIYTYPLTPLTRFLGL